MDLGSYVRFPNCTQYRRTTGVNDLPNDRVDESEVVDMPVSDEAMDGC